MGNATDVARRRFPEGVVVPHQRDDHHPQETTMHPEYLAIYALLQGRIRTAETQRRARAARAYRPPRRARRTVGDRRRPSSRRGGEAA